MRKVIILRGLPASGKSVWAKEQVAKSNCSIKRVNKDDLRSMLDAGKYSKGNESYVLQLRDHIILTALDLGKSVIVDDTNFYLSHEERIRELVSGFNEGMYGNNISINNKVQVEVKFFDVSPEECIIRDLKRPNSVGAKVIWDMYNKYLKPEPEKIEPMKQDTSLPHAVIIDLDGSLAIHNERLPFEYDKCHTDLVNKSLQKILQMNINSECCDAPIIIYVSGREDSCKQKTIQWLKDNDVWDDQYAHKLYMRKTRDNRKDTIIKKEIFEEFIKDKYYIDYIVDDRPCVIRMWKELGFFVFNVGDGHEF